MHLDLSDPVRTIAHHLSRDTLQVENNPDVDAADYSRWVLITDDRDLLDTIETAGWSTPWSSEQPRHLLWTDDYCNLLQVIAWE